MTSSKWNSCASVLLLHVLVVSFCCPPSYSQSKPTLKAPTRTSVIDRMFAHEFNQDKTGALTVGLVERGRLEWTKGYGFLDTMTATGRNLNGVPEYTILVTWSTPVVLPAGTYWENVTPQCTNTNNGQCTAQGFSGFLESDMETMYGLNAWGPPEPWQNSFWNAPIFGLFWENTFNVHQQRGEPGGDAFSAGVIGMR